MLKQISVGEMMDHIALCTVLVLFMFISGLMSYDLNHKRYMNSEMNEKDQFLQENEDMTKAEENLNSNFFEGDILTTPEQMKAINQLIFHHTHDGSKSVEKPYTRGLVKDMRRIWPQGIVYYKISDSLPSDRQQMIKDAIEHWKQRTCLQFKERTDEKDYVNFQLGPGCASYVGRIERGGQRLVVGPQCKLGNIIHEIGHAIGFFHEMSRPDRDEFVKIISKNILPNRHRNFLKYSNSIIDSRGVPYDYKSIMHYSKLHFSKDPAGNKQTIVPKDPTAEIGQRDGLSPDDIKQAKILYSCGNNMVDGFGQRQDPSSPDDNMGENGNMDGNMGVED